MVTANLIILKLIMVLRKYQRNYVLPNIYINGWEADLYSETNRYSVEYEIKLTRSDFFNDFKKGNKHQRIQDGKRINRFYFVVPFPMKDNKFIWLNEIPSYAGLIYYYVDKDKFVIIKQAPILNKEKITHHKTILNVCYSKYIEYSRKFYQAAIKKEKKNESRS